MATSYENIGLIQMESALNKLRQDYAEACSAELRRDQLMAFMTGIYSGLETLGGEAGADIDALVWDLETVRQSIESAFVDAIDAHERSEPRIDPVREWGTYNVMNGRVA